MQFLTLLTLCVSLVAAAPVLPAHEIRDIVARQTDTGDAGTSSDRNPLAGLLNGGQQSDSDGEANAVSTSECGLLACTSGAAASNGNNTSSSTSATDYNISIGKLSKA